MSLPGSSSPLPNFKQRDSRLLIRYNSVVRTLRLFLRSFVSVCCAALVCLLLSTHSVQAQSVGTHLGEGDVGAQISIVQLLRSKGAGSGFPVTVLLNVNTTVQSAATDLANAVKNAGFVPIVRLTHVCSPLDSGLTPVAAVTAVQSAFGANTVVVWGNEINNPNECGDIAAYVRGYSQIASMPNVSPAALDYYNGIHPVPKFFQEYAATGIEQIYQAATVRAANAYGCTFGPTADSCDPLTTDTHRIGYQAISVTKYLTEFSLSPEGRKADAPDTDIKKVVQFIQSRAAETGAQLITPLIRNVCNDEGEWLLYVNGKVFTQRGTEVTENCEGLSGYGYDTSIYPEYGVEPDKYYLHPIRGILPAGNVPRRSVAEIRKDLSNQGYEAYCAAPKSTIKLDISTVEDMEKYIQQYGGIRLDASSEYQLDMSSSNIPIYRDVDGKRFLMSSMEEYFGFKDVWVGTPYEAELNSAPINSLVSTTQRCIQSVETLKNVQLMCERLTDPSKCALLARPIPGTNENFSTLVDKVADRIPKYREGGIPQGCRALFHSGAAQPQGHSELQTAILNVPLHLDRSYRLAFLVAAIEYKKFESPKLFNFFTELNRDADPRHEVLVVGFKIPDIITNKGGGETSGHQYWDDPAVLTRAALVPQQKTEEIKIMADELRSKFAQRAADATRQSETSAIYCVNGGTADNGYADGSGSPACKDELGKALVDMINGNTPGCENIETELVGQVVDSGTLHVSEEQIKNSGLLYDQGYGFGETLLRDLFLNNPYQLTTQRTDTPEKALSLYDIKRGWNIGEQAEAKFYLLYPIGYELREVTNILKATFLSDEQQIALLDEHEPADRFEVTSGTFGLQGGSVSKDFDDKETCRFVFDPLPRWACDKKEFALNLIEVDKEGLGITGAELGYWMRNVQKAITPLYTRAHAYLTSCRTTEQFLLGQCAGGMIATMSGDGGPNSGTGSTGGKCVSTYPITEQKLNPPYTSATPLSPEATQVPPTPYVGKAKYYAKGLMNDVLRTRKRFGQILEDKITACDGTDSKYKGCVALLRAGDIGRDIWMQLPGGSIEGPYLVIDVAARHDIPCLLEDNWIVDVDYDTAMRWGMDGPIDGVKLYDSK